MVNRLVFGADAVDILVRSNKKFPAADSWSGAEIFRIIGHAIDGQRFEFVGRLEYMHIAVAGNEVDFSIGKDG